VEIVHPELLRQTLAVQGSSVKFILADSHRFLAGETAAS
jgi:hypothetical protein